MLQDPTRKDFFENFRQTDKLTRDNHVNLKRSLINKYIFL